MIRLYSGSLVRPQMTNTEESSETCRVCHTIESSRSNACKLGVSLNDKQRLILVVKLRNSRRIIVVVERNGGSLIGI